MVAVVGASLALAQLFGLLTLRRSAQMPHPMPAARLPGEVAKGS